MHDSSQAIRSSTAGVLQNDGSDRAINIGKNQNTDVRQQNRGHLLTPLHPRLATWSYELRRHVDTCKDALTNSLRPQTKCRWAFLRLPLTHIDKLRSSRTFCGFQKDETSTFPATHLLFFHRLVPDDSTCSLDTSTLLVLPKTNNCVSAIADDASTVDF